MKKILFCAAAMVAMVGLSTARADISYVGTSLSQNFDSLTTSTSSTSWTNNSTLSGWSLFTGAGTPITTYSGGTGSSSTGSFYSFGASAATDRALGGLASGGTYFGSPSSGAVAGYIAVQITNNSGSALDSFTLGFEGEQWRNGGNTTAQAMVLEYGFGSTFAGVTTWTAPGGAFNWSSVVNTSTAAAVDGNVAGKVPGLGGTVSSLTWNTGSSLWVRWIDVNDSGNDHGLAIDNFTFSATAVPEPASAGLIGLGLAGLSLIRRRK